MAASPDETNSREGSQVLPLGSSKEQPKASARAEESDGKVVELKLTDYWEDSYLPERLQTLLTNLFVFFVVHYTFWFVPVCLAAYFLVQTGWTWVVALLAAAYLPSFFDGSQKSAHGKPWDALRSLGIWNLVPANYLRMKILRERPDEDESKKKYVIGYHPHGILVLSRFALFARNWEQLFPHTSFRFLGASAIFALPFCRDISLWLGAVDASRATADKVLASGKSATIYPGGIPEMFVSDRDASETVLILKKRLGFIKLAMRNGADLVPVMVFNEKYLYNVWTPPPRLAAMVRKTLRVPLIAFWGRFMWMPLQPPEGKTFGLVFGKPISVVQNASPSEEEVAAVQAMYASELSRLFEQYKGAFGCDDGEKLVIT